MGTLLFSREEDKFYTKGELEESFRRINRLVTNYSLETETARFMVDLIPLFQYDVTSKFVEHLELLETTLQLTRADNNGETVKLTTIPLKGSSNIRTIGKDNFKFILLFLNDLINKQLHQLHYKSLLGKSYSTQKIYNYFEQEGKPLYEFCESYSEEDLIRMVSYWRDYIEKKGNNRLKQQIKLFIGLFKASGKFDKTKKTLSTDEACALYDCIVWAGCGNELKSDGTETSKEKYDKIKSLYKS